MKPQQNSQGGYWLQSEDDCNLEMDRVSIFTSMNTDVCADIAILTCTDADTFVIYDIRVDADISLDYNWTLEGRQINKDPLHDSYDFVDKYTDSVNIVWIDVLLR